ncbi:bifunctional [glutamine synthetase] adenylyltransferase/[glutamine synthetase]-adenylyl-L-tyrosine phosphorylase [Acuticoccus sp. M5D2P5]|uniref:bifunctional [glutamine synthetase] adenylyltransferase/[glutamine synthetase]-adenylyl-L-tyrosine phosphorylase n=1 Tax=Acuticoccus kalidii TaxID=2910977 RepID=UPI001F48D9A1|nr:bifunctional [glutamine synthetase] adenylyltransferase/[glutamine synthetase]-adenylyl-L-tyrosine phosphorylase [Acuticoccus kalidii]MCF3935097.1 bifunctional [glutamine synthetase] adenylyltransferase/[glutamine synthetase]-adenylyl-L-tyrosine phosphorylase [Acuticoccus kalidii]
MTGPLLARLTALPGPVDEAFADEIAPAVAGLDGAGEGTVAALASAASVSPFLRHLMLARPELLAEVLTASLAETVAAACTVTPDADLDRVSAELRQAKTRVALAVALADLLCGASVATVTGALSDIADHAISVALESQLIDAARRGAIDDPDPAKSGIIILALGKLGAHELNYSSDVDLVALYNPSRAGARGIDGGRAVRIVQRLAKMLAERTADGYVFRIDLRLRPDPGSTPVAVSTRNAIAYFQTRARPWERQARIKARQVAGDYEAGDAYLQAIERSVWRAAYDFSAIDDTMEMREQIAMVRGAGTLTLPGHNLKLGRGGIREVEFFVQSIQRVAGGRDRHLRARGTVEALAALAETGWIEPQTRDELTAAYETLRKAEHCVQMVADEQTHALPEADGLARIARMMRTDDLEGLLVPVFEVVHRHFVSLNDVVGQRNPTLASMRTGGVSMSDELERSIDTTFERWLSGDRASLKTERARDLLKGLRGDITRAIAASTDPEATLVELDGFFARLPAGIDLLSRLDLQRDLVSVLVLIVATAPRLAGELALRAHLLDVLVDPAFFGNLPGVQTLETQLDASLDAAMDYEGKLDALRVFGQEQALLINVRILTGSVLGPEAASATTRLADVLVRRALAVASEAFAERHGDFEGGGVALLALGKFGSREMTATSDLDIVFLYDCPEGVGESNGEKPLSPGHYFTRLAQRFIAALSAPTARGTLYEVDLRLRPSGKSGPIATHIRSFERYHEESAWVWEHMALTRARVVAGEDGLCARAMAAVDRAITIARDVASLRTEIASMRRRISEQGRGGLKHMPGGQVDIEFIAQFLTLKNGLVPPVGETGTVASLDRARAAGDLSEDDHDTLVSAYRLFERLSQLISIASSGSIRLTDAPLALQRVLVRAGEAPDIDFLNADLTQRGAAVREIFERLIGPLEGEPVDN